jgi:hypothetical protein
MGQFDQKFEQVTGERNRKYQNILHRKFTNAAEKSTGKVRGTLGRHGLTKYVNK